MKLVTIVALNAAGAPAVARSLSTRRAARSTWRLRVVARGDVRR